MLKILLNPKPPLMPLFSPLSVFQRYFVLTSGVFIFLNLFSYSTLAQNQKLDSIKNVIPQKIRTVFKTNPTAILIGVIPGVTSEYRLLVEFPSAPLQSSQLGISYLGKSPFIRFVENMNAKKNPNAIFLRMYISGFRLQGSYRFFINEWMQRLGFFSQTTYSPEGFYFSPHTSYSTVKITYKFANQYDVFYRVNHFNINLLAGWQIVMSGKYTVDIFTGIGYKENVWTEHFQNKVTTVTPPKGFDIPGYFGPVKYNFGVNFGYCF